MYAGHNIRINIPNLQTIEINDQLNRYEIKDDIHSSDDEFHSLIDIISERKIPDEIERAVKLLLKFGSLRQQKMENETNFFKQRNYPKYIVPFYKKAI